MGQGALSVGTPQRRHSCREGAVTTAQDDPVRFAGGDFGARPVEVVPAVRDPDSSAPRGEALNAGRQTDVFAEAACVKIDDELGRQGHCAISRV